MKPSDMALRGNFGGKVMIDDGFEHNPEISRQALASLHVAAFGWALSLTGHDAATAEDVMQQSYLALLEGRARYNGRSSLKTWFYAVIRNTARRQLRRRRLERSTIERFGETADTQTASAAEEPPNTIPAPGLREAVHSLPARQREVLELVIDAEFTLEQSAVVLGISVGSARTHYHRAKQTLRRVLEPDHGQ